MGHPCGYFLGTSFSKICNFNREFKTKSFRGRISIICRSSVAAIYQNKPLSPVSFFNCRNGLLCVGFRCIEVSVDGSSTLSSIFHLFLSNLLSFFHNSFIHTFVHTLFAFFRFVTKRS